MHECFNYDNYEKGLDHTFGVHSEGRREIMENPGDEGQSRAGSRDSQSILDRRGHPLRRPQADAHAPPAVVVGHDGVCGLARHRRDGRTHRIRFTVRHERWLRRCTVEMEGIGRFEGTDIRFGPFPRLLSNPKSYETELIGNASWIWVRGIKGDKRTITVEL